MVARSRLNVTLYLHYLPCLFLNVLIVRVCLTYKFVTGKFIFKQVANNQFMKPENSLLCIHQPTAT